MSRSHWHRGRTPPSPYLSHIPNRDIEIPSGKKLTLMNPAYILRQMMAEFPGLYGIRGRITSLNPLNPDNAPDAWEKKALAAFEKGVEEVQEFTHTEQGGFLRYMSPLQTSKGCLKCHGHQGYQEGDIRGGVGVIVPMTPFFALEREMVNTLIWTHGSFWIMGVMLIALIIRYQWSRILDRRRTEAALREKEIAERTDKVKSAFLAHMSHELRTPLNGILGFIRLLRRNPETTPSQMEDLDVIDRSGEHLLSLINDVLEISKIGAERVVAEQSSFDFHELIMGIREMFEERARSKDLDFICHLDSSAPRYIRSDERKLRQILTNLLGNAMKYTMEGGVNLRIRGSGSGDGAGEGGTMRLHFEVEDTGEGIAAEEMATIFDPFVQTQSGLKAQEGTGLGLSISRKYVQLLGGDISIDSREGKGTLVKFDMAVEPAEGTDVQPRRASNRVVGLQGDRHEYRILVVEDRLDNRRLLTRLLLKIGFQVKEAANGQEGVEQFEEWHPHLIFMDMRMPVMDGYEAAKRIKASDKGQATPLIALTASVFSDDREHVLSAGCDDYIRKPFREQELFDAIGRFLDVRFIVESENIEKPDDSGESQLSVMALARLPEASRLKLKQAVVELDSEKVLALVKEMSMLDRKTMKALESMISRFEFKRLQALLEESGENHA